MAFDSRHALNSAIRYLTSAAMQRNAGGWVPPKEKARQEQAQQKQFIADEKEREKNLSAFQKGNDPFVPHVMYHGTKYGNIDDFGGFRGSAGHFAFDPKVANGYAQSDDLPIDDEYFHQEGPQVYPVHISAKKVFDARNPEHVKSVKFKSRKNWNYEDLEKAIPAIKDAGFDSYLDFEHGRTTLRADGRRYPNEPQGIAVFHPHQIKSATGNTGHFDPSNPDITKSEGGLILSKQFPTHYMPNVGRQVMAKGGKAKQHPALSIPGVHIREEEHGTPIFTGER